MLRISIVNELEYFFLNYNTKRKKKINILNGKSLLTADLNISKSKWRGMLTVM